MLFHGELELSNDPGSRLVVTLTMESDALSLATGDENLGTWNRPDTKAVEIARGKYDLTLGNETLLFTPENVPLFASRGLPFFDEVDEQTPPAGLLAKIKKWGLKPADFATQLGLTVPLAPGTDPEAATIGPLAEATARNETVTIRADDIDQPRRTHQTASGSPVESIPTAAHGPGPVKRLPGPQVATSPDPTLPSGEPDDVLLGSRPRPTVTRQPDRLPVTPIVMDPLPDAALSAVTEPTTVGSPGQTSRLESHEPETLPGPLASSVAGQDGRSTEPATDPISEPPTGAAPTIRPVIPIEFDSTRIETVEAEPVQVAAPWSERTTNQDITPSESLALSTPTPTDALPGLPGLPDLAGLLARLETAVDDLQAGRMEPARGRAIADVVRAMCRAVEVSGHGAKDLNSIADKLDNGQGLGNDVNGDHE